MTNTHESRLQLLFDTMAEGVVLIAPDGAIVEANAAAENILGLRHGQLTGRNISSDWKLLHPDGTPMSPEEMMEVPPITERRPVRNLVMGIERPDGSTIWINVSASPLLSGAGEVEGVVGIFGDITKHKRTETKYRAILETALDGFFVADFGGRFLEVNDSYCKMVGYPREELLTMSISDVEAAEKPEETAQHIENLMKLAYDRFETRHRRKDGRIINVEVSAHYIELEDRRIVSFVRDVTEHRQAEQALRESEQKYRTLAENIPQRTFLKDKNSVYISCNSKLAEDLKIKPEEISGRTDYDFFPRDLAEKYRADDQRVIESGNTQILEERYMQDGQERLVETFKTPVRDERGELIGILGIFHDMTERKRTEETLLEYKTAVEQSVDGIVVVDMRGYVRFVNEAWSRMHGYSVEELTGRHSSIFHTRARMKSEVTPFCQHLRQTGSNAGEVWHVNKNGEEFLAWMTTTVLKGPDQKPFGLLAVMRDITEQKEAERRQRDQQITEAREQELAKSRRRLLSAQESLRKEIASQLHGTVQSRLILLGHKLAELEARPASERTTEELAQVREKLEEVQNDLIRPISHRLFPSVLRLGIAAGLESLVDEYSAALPVDLQVSRQVRDIEEANRKAVPDNAKLALYRIAEETLSNIAKHTPGVSNIVLRLSLAGSRVLRLTVSDDGDGFNKASSATGIGLMITSDYAAAAGGTCSIKSKPGKGTRVAAKVPLGGLEANRLQNGQASE
jgi:PAS domain S-box-containing protein